MRKNQQKLKNQHAGNRPLAVTYSHTAYAEGGG